MDDMREDFSGFGTVRELASAFAPVEDFGVEG
jgi:hypothetical protein